MLALTLPGVAIFHARNLEVALSGLVVITLCKGLVVQDVDLIAHFLHEEKLGLILLGLMIRFGSSAGVAMSNLYPQAKKNTLAWLREGCDVPAAYVLGFAVHYLLLGWHPDVLPETWPARSAPFSEHPAAFACRQRATV